MMDVADERDDHISAPDQPTDAVGGEPSTGKAKQNPFIVGVAAAGTITSVLMFIALFMPWATTSSGNQSLSDYSAPQPAIIAWVLLALGLATVIVTVGSFAFGTRGSVLALGSGGFLYACGAMVWYASSVLPDMIATGCNNNGGSLCQVAATNPTVPGIHVGSGFVLGLASAVVLSTVCIVMRGITAEAERS